MAHEERTWNPRFIEYMKFIVGHPNYRGMPDVYKADKSIRWIVAGKSEHGQARTKWWREKARELKIPVEGKWIAKVAKANHPTKIKVCQTCGREMSTEYVYPNKHLITRLNQIPGYEGRFQYEDFQSIYEIMEYLIKESGSKGYRELSEIFAIPGNIEKTFDSYRDFVNSNYVVLERGNLSPGVMSNAPDRLDGFHSYNICCRKTEDTGRHDDNLSRYTEDRRAYENWADGDWKAASWLMGRHGKGKCNLCQKEGDVTADHIGPLSLGFAHLPVFIPLCKSCNSAKNNRLFYEDVKKLIALEKQGNQVTSWHAKYLWDRLKGTVHNDKDALQLSKLMRISHHYFLEIFYQISKKGHKDFLLQYLHPEYALYEDINFENLNPATFEYDSIMKKAGDKKNYLNNAGRYIRIAFDSLEEYHEKENRRITAIIDEPDQSVINEKLREILSILYRETDRSSMLWKVMEASFRYNDKNTRSEAVGAALEITDFGKKNLTIDEADKKIKELLQFIAIRLEKKWKVEIEE
jgi:Alw26I/Eco31I/Esp3I family type II restriction endonuclease